MFYPLLRSLDPFERRIPPRAVVLRTLRLALILCVLLIGAFGLVYRLADSALIDPAWIRVVWIVLALAFLIGTYTDNAIRRRAKAVLSVYLLGVHAWLGGLLVVNSLNAEMAVGYVFTMCGAGVLIGFAYNRVVPVAMFFSGTVIIGLAAAAAVPTPDLSPLLFELVVVSTALALFLASYARIAVHREKREDEIMLQDAERIGALGSFTMDAASGQRHWSRGMYRLIGEAPRLGPPPSFPEFVAPEYLPSLLELVRQLREGQHESVTLRFDYLRSDGTPFPVESVIRMDRTDEGEPHQICGVVRDLSRQVEYEQGLDAARQAAEEANALKSAILANMSHEIRTPLTHILGYTQLLRMDAEDATVEIVDIIESGAQRLLDTLSALMDLAQIEAGTAALSQATVDVAAEAVRIADRFRTDAEAEGLAFHVEVPPEPVVALADPAALGRSLSNLLSNAIKFTTEGAVSVRVTNDTGSVCVEVSDTGRGIAPEFLSHLFDSFVQESSGLTRSHEGTGLGLAITHRLVSAMGGSLDVTSEPGRGSTFSLRLPSDLGWVAREPVLAHAEPDPGGPRERLIPLAPAA